MASHPNNTKLLPPPRTEYILLVQGVRHELHIKYIHFQTLSLIKTGDILKYIIQ